MSGHSNDGGNRIPQNRARQHVDSGDVGDRRHQDDILASHQRLKSSLTAGHGRDHQLGNAYG